MRKASVTDLLKEALALDAAGNERGAVPLYRRVISKGLKPKNLHTALIGLGSSLRTVGEVQASIRTLQKARKLFPGDPAITLFLAISHRDAGQHDLAIRQLADALLKESRRISLAPYRNILKQKFHALR